MMYRVAEVLMDKDGKYYVNIPTYDQGGTIGYGTNSVGEKELHETCVFLESILRKFHPELLNMITKEEEK